MDPLVRARPVDAKRWTLNRSRWDSKDVLLPTGIHLAEIDLDRTVTADALLRGLEAMGWSEIALDEGSLPAPGTVRFVGKLGAPLEARDTEHVRWSHVSPVPFDVFGPMRLSVYPFQLVSGTTYAMRVVARMRSHEKRADVLAALHKEGFEILKLSELKNNARLPGRPGASVSFWYALGVWQKPSNYINIEYPLYFEDLAPVHGGPLVVTLPEQVQDTLSP